MIVVIILLVVVAILICMMLWCLISMYYTEPHYSHMLNRINEIYNENIRRINEGNDDLVDYDIVFKEPSHYWCVRINQKLGLWESNKEK